MKVDLTYPRKFICVQSSSLPVQPLSFTEQANHIAQFTNITPFERMKNLLRENTIEKSIKELWNDEK